MFAPIYGEHSHTLIVGTWPSPKSREDGFYYAHPQNRFWPLMARIYNADKPKTVNEKKALIIMNGIALWDTLQSCTINGASDASIRNAVPNDLAALCKQLSVSKILCNGSTAYMLCLKYNHTLSIPVVKLPSTSPANAAFSIDKLSLIWAKALLS